MDSKRLDRLIKRLNSTLPLFGAAIRRSACKELAANAGAVAVPHLVETLNAADPQLVLTADAGLRSLQTRTAVDSLCVIWAGQRDPRLGSIIRNSGYVASGPAEVRVLSALKAGKPEIAGEKGTHIASLVAALSDQDQMIASCAERSLQSLVTQESIDALCGLWARSRDQQLGNVIAAKGYVASGPTKVRMLSALKAGKPEIAGEKGTHIASLVAALSDQDPSIASCAERRLQSLGTQEGIDALCGLWASSRDEQLGNVIAAKGYVASGPTEARVLTALIANKLGDLDLVGQEMEALVHATDDKDSEIAARAERALRTLGNVLSRNALCAMAIQDPKGKPARICIEQGWRPSDPNDACLFLCVTEQIEEYFREDFEFQNLRLAYDRADEHVRARVLAIVRSGDRRWQGFFGVKKPASQCTAAEIELAIDSGLRHADWPQLWSLFQQVAFKYTWRILGPLLDSGWKPTNDEDRKTFEAVLEAATGGGTRYEPQEDNDPFSFADLLAQGRNGELARKSEAELLSALAAASPPDAIPIVGAISTTCGATSGAARAVMASPHWMVRLAGSVAGLGQFDTNLLLSADGFMLTKDQLELFWPLRATPEDLENLRTWPLASVAKDAVQMYCVLEQVLFARLTTGTFTEVEIEAAEDAGEFEEVQ